MVRGTKPPKPHPPTPVSALRSTSAPPQPRLQQLCSLKLFFWTYFKWFIIATLHLCSSHLVVLWRGLRAGCPSAVGIAKSPLKAGFIIKQAAGRAPFFSPAASFLTQDGVSVFGIQPWRGNATLHCFLLFIPRSELAIPRQKLKVLPDL